MAAHLLNADKNNRPVVKKSRLLILLVLRLQALEAKISAYEAEERRARKSARDFENLEYEVDELISPINRLLKRYSVTPSLVHFVSPFNWVIRWDPNPNSRKQDRLIEFMTVLHLIELAKSGRISALKQCAKCQKWFFARFSHQRFCSDSCKDGFHISNEADKKRRREWAKKNYWLKKKKLGK